MRIKKLFKRKTKLTQEEAIDILVKLQNAKTKDHKTAHKILSEGLKDKK